MSLASFLQCTWCQKTYPANQLMNLCPNDGRPVEVILDIERINSEFRDNSWYHPQLKSMWRFGAMLPLNGENPDEASHIVSLGEGYTPHIQLTQHPLAQQHKFNLYLKDEGQPHAGFGVNPTGSFKDRGMSMAVSMAKRFGVNKVVVPTQGNAGDSLAEYAIKAGMEVVVIIPDDTPMPILGRVSALSRLHDNVNLELVEGTIKEAGALMKEKYLPQGYFNMATFQEPGWRIEGKKTLGYELAEPRDDDKNWQVPDVIIYPTGGGTGILGMWKAFDELQQIGLIDDKRPRIIAVQSEQTAPLVRAFQSGEKSGVIVEAGETIATGLNVPGGVGHFKVLQIVTQSGGAAISVSESAIAESLKQTYQQTGLWICPEGAATLAALETIVDSGLIQSGEKVVAINTGSFEKYLPNVKKLIFGNSSNLPANKC